MLAHGIFAAGGGLSVHTRKNNSNVRVSRSVKGCYIYYGHTILTCLANAGCLADPKNPEMSLVDPESPELSMIFYPGP